MKKEEKEELEKLFREIKQGNKKKIEELYNKYNKIVYGIAFSILKNKEDSEDIVQIVFSKLFSIEKNKLPNKKAGTWLYKVTKNEVLAVLRKKYDTIRLDNIYNCENENNEINEFIDKESYNKLINKLSKKEQEIVSLKILSELTFAEIAELLGESSNTIKWRYYKAIYTLKIALSNLGMFIITFGIGVVSLKNKKKQSLIIKGDQDINNIDNKTEVKPSEPVHIEDEETNLIVEDAYNIDFTENVIIEDRIINTTNYLSIIIFSISAIFLILTIIFSLLFAKHQLNARKKSSKYLERKKVRL